MGTNRISFFTPCDPSAEKVNKRASPTPPNNIGEKVLACSTSNPATANFFLGCPTDDPIMFYADRLRLYISIFGSFKLLLI